MVVVHPPSGLYMANFYGRPFACYILGIIENLDAHHSHATIINNNNNTEPCTHQFSINFHLENLNTHHSHATISFHLENLDPRPRCGGLFGYVRGVCLFDPVIPRGVCDVPHRIGENVPDTIYVETLFNQVDAF